MTAKNLDWNSFVGVVQTNKSIPVYFQEADGWELYAKIKGQVCRTYIYIGSAEETDFLNNYKSKWDSVTERDDDGIYRIAQTPAYEKLLTIVTHNYADPCTWYSSSVRVIGEELQPKISGQYDVYTSVNVNWIDLENGRLFDEDSFNTEYKVSIRVNDNPAQADINYEAGEVTFQTPLTATDVVSVDYSYATNNQFKVIPLSGSRLDLLYTELKISSSFDFSNKCFVFDEYGYDPLNLPNLKLYRRVRYKSMYDIIADSDVYSYTRIPAINGMGDSLDSFRWNRDYVRKIDSADGGELHLSLYDSAITNNNVFASDLSGNRIDIAYVRFRFVVR